MAGLEPCAQCLRHVVRDAPVCPFCDARLGARPEAGPHLPVTTRVTRAAIFAGATLLLPACGSGGGCKSEASDPDDRDPVHNVAKPYGAPPRPDELV